MQVKKGIPVSPGVAIYPVVVLDAVDRRIPRRTVTRALIVREHERLEKALDASTKEIERLRDQTAESLGKFSQIFSAHIAMLDDPHVIGQIREMINNDRVTAEYAVYAVMRQFTQAFLQHENKFLRDRASDVRDLEHRILRQLIGHTHSDIEHLEQQSIVIAHDLTPSQTAALDTTKIRAIATDAGGRTSHTAILAHALGIPAIVGLEEVTRLVSTGETAIIDGNRGLVVIDPDAERIMEYRQEERRFAAFEDTLGQLKALPAVTQDGTDINLQANIEFPTEIPETLANGATGVGLYRTEFLFLATDSQPTEQEQFESYCRVIKALDGRPLTIRTLDLGADKIGRSLSALNGENAERNPFLGCRSIRMCLQNLPLFKTQLRAILRASVNGPLRIMFPLISNIMELRQARMILGDVMEDLQDQGIPFRENIPVGIMIEVPSAALQARVFAREVDFFSIGTNDLIQYTVAVDRGNERIASLYSAAHPAVLELVRQVIQVADQANMEVSLCGEMAGEPEFAMLLIGLGLRNLSITPPAIPEIKKIIRSVSIDQCRHIARKANSFDSDREIISYLRGEVSKVLPEAFASSSITF